MQAARALRCLRDCASRACAALRSGWHAACSYFVFVKEWRFVMERAGNPNLLARKIFVATVAYVAIFGFSVLIILSGQP
jgi:hypothetical protein